MNEYKLSQLKQLEAESIRIFRDAVSQFENPILLYSIGKDSSVLVRLAQKAFYPGKIPFKLLHIDSTWKFKEMIQFRDDFCTREGLDLIVHHNKEGKAEGVNPFDHGSRKYTDIMKTQALLQALSAGKYDVAFGGARRDEEKSRRKREYIPSATDIINGTLKTSVPNSGPCITAGSTPVKVSGYFRFQTGRKPISGSISGWKK